MASDFGVVLIALLRSTSIFIESDHSLCFGLNIKLNPKHSSREQSNLLHLSKE